MKTPDEFLKTTKRPLGFLNGNSEMVELMRQKNWDETVVGPPKNWPQSLRTTLSIIMENKFPMFLFWGEDLICFYNDAYRPSLGKEGKHPHILGEPGADYWEEIWHIIFPLLDNVRKTGEAYWSEDQLVPIYRNGKIEEVYWTFSYSPIRDESYEIGGILVTCNETTEKVINLNKLKESEDQLRFAIEATELGTWDYNPKTNTFTANERLRNWFGLDKRKDIELSLATDRMIDEDRDRIISAIQKTLEPKNDGNFEEQFTIENSKTGNRRIVMAKGRAWFDNGESYRFNGTLQDVTAQAQEYANFLKQNNETLQNYITQLQKSNDELQSFAYVSSHDLQEPLRKITIFISRIIDRQQLNEKDKKDFERIRVSAERMRQLITDLLNYSRIGNEKVDKQPTDILKVVNEVCEELNEVIKANKSSITIGELSTLPVIQYQFRQLIINLISNALKFAKVDTPLKIDIYGEKLNSINDVFPKADANQTYYKISIEDNGIGFSPKQGKRIFEVFQTLHSKSDYKGTGIGLAIVKKIVGEHNGFIKAIGKEGKGAIFEVYLPM